MPRHPRRACATITALLLVASGACATIPASGPVSAAPLERSDWATVLAEHTRRAESFDWTVRQADLRAALVTPRLRKAFLDGREGFHGKLAAEFQTELVGLGEPDEGVDAPMKAAPDAESDIVILVALYVTDQKNRDISASYTIWDTTLAVGEQRLRPKKMETLRNSPAAAEVFPFIDRFDDLYLLRFAGPLPAQGGPLKLELHSARARAAVEWTLKP